jgi:uncharacterized protein
VEQLARYSEAHADVVVSRDGDELIFWSDYDDFGKSIVSESRITVDDFLTKGEGPWPWYDLRDKRDGALLVLDALDAGRPTWTVPLSPEVHNLFRSAEHGTGPAIAQALRKAVNPDPLDPCGATPLWYGVRSGSSVVAVALIDAGADATRRIELSARGERFTTILHEIVRCGLTVPLQHALARGADPSVKDSDGATPLHVVGEHGDHVNPEMVRGLVAAGAAVDAAMPSGTQPIELAARRLLSGTVAAMVELGADPQRGLDSVVTWWAVAADVFAYRARDVAELVEILRAGGANPTDRHWELAAGVGAREVMAALSPTAT